MNECGRAISHSLSRKLLLQAGDRVLKDVAPLRSKLSGTLDQWRAVGELQRTRRNRMTVVDGAQEGAHQSGQLPGRNRRQQLSVRALQELVEVHSVNVFPNQRLVAL